MRIFFCCLLLTFGSRLVLAQSVAQQRAQTLGLGMNLSYLENFWNGTSARHFNDFVKFNEVLARKQRLADIAQAGFKTVRLPVCFSAWANFSKPFQWDAPASLAAPDSLVRWALANKLNVIIDLHHVELDGSSPSADSTDRVVWLWQQIAERYKNTDPARVFFELRNEPHDMPAAVWRAQAQQLINTVRAIAPKHTLIVGFHDWNGRDALLSSDVFADPNIIYTFHFYDPFIFTHQGATWAGQGLSDLQGVTFPANPSVKVAVPAAAKGTWVEGAITNYANEGTYDVIYQRIVAAKTWSTTKNVPIFLGEFGSYGYRSAPDSRCRHAEAIYLALGKLQIPSAWWEWDGGFSMFGTNTTTIMPCMQNALATYATGELSVLAIDPVTTSTLTIYPNPAQTVVDIVSTGQPADMVTITDVAGRVLASVKLPNNQLSIANLSAGQYWLTVYTKTGTVLGTKQLQINDK